ncbi:MAG: hypothetical protein ABJE66_06630 [Deltaproteobacteria bacterium]
MKRLLLTIAICGCQPVSQVGSQRDATTTDTPIAHACDGTHDDFVFSGASDFVAYDFGFTTLGGKIVGIAGSGLNADILSFNLTKFTFDLEALGDHDVATQNLTSLHMPYDPASNGHTCDPGNTVCHGFYAQSGTYTVNAVHPRYQATFTLSNLKDRTDNTSPPGAAIAGTLTGCVDKANP